MSMDKEWMNRVPSPFPAVVVTHLPPDGRTKGASVSQPNNSHRWAAVFLLWRVGPVRWMGTLICIGCEIWTLLLLVLEVCLSVCSSYFISLPPPGGGEGGEWDSPYPFIFIFFKRLPSFFFFSRAQSVSDCWVGRSRLDLEKQSNFHISLFFYFIYFIYFAALLFIF